MSMILFPWKTIWLQDGSQVCLASNTKNEKAFDPMVDDASLVESQLPLYEYNHGLYRLKGNGEIIWQIQRNEGAWTAWEKGRKESEEKNSDDSGMNLFTSPFVNLWLRLADGSTHEKNYQFPETDTWVDGATVCCRTFDSKEYELDIETGIATIVTPTGGRPW